MDLPVFVSASNYRLFIHEDDAKTAPSIVDPGRGVQCFKRRPKRGGGKSVKAWVITIPYYACMVWYGRWTRVRAHLDVLHIRGCLKSAPRPDGPGGLENKRGSAAARPCIGGLRAQWRLRIWMEVNGWGWDEGWAAKTLMDGREPDAA